MLPSRGYRSALRGFRRKGAAMKIPTRFGPGAASRRQGALDLMMTPMIDVVFLLLVYFIATTSFQKPENQMPTGVAKPP
ncbi:MAG: ExbD/TolR family protein, partial [Pirellulaceae bacterium]